MYPKKIILLFALLLSSMSHLALAEETSESEGTHTYITEYEGPVCGTIELEDDEQLCEHPGEDNGCFRGTFIDIEDEENEYFWVCDHNYQNVLCSAPKDDCDNEIKAEVNLSYDC